MRPRTCACGAAFTPGGGRQLRCDQCRDERRPPQASCRSCGAAFAPRGRQLRCDACLGAPAERSGPKEITWAVAPSQAKVLEQARGDLESLRRSAESLLRRYARDASPYSRGIQAAALTLLNAAGFARHPTERRYASREELAGSVDAAAGLATENWGPASGAARAPEAEAGEVADGATLGGAGGRCPCGCGSLPEAGGA